MTAQSFEAVLGLFERDRWFVDYDSLSLVGELCRKSTSPVKIYFSSAFVPDTQSVEYIISARLRAPIQEKGEKLLELIDQQLQEELVGEAFLVFASPNWISIEVHVPYATLDSDGSLGPEKVYRIIANQLLSFSALIYLIGRLLIICFRDVRRSTNTVSVENLALLTKRFLKAKPEKYDT